MVPRYSASHLKVAYKDTGSLVYLIETPYLYKDVVSFKHLLDFSDYPQEHFLHDQTNKIAPITITDNLQGKVLRENICLWSKLYSIKYIQMGRSRALKAFKSQSKKH